MEVRTAELVEALERLDASRGRAEGAARDKAIFLSFLCHELRNPLHAITNMAEFLLEDLASVEPVEKEKAGKSSTTSPTHPSINALVTAVSPTSQSSNRRRSLISLASSILDSQTRSARAIKLSSEYMLALVNDVLDLGRFEAGRVSLEKLVINIHALLESNFACAHELVRGHDVKFKPNMNEDVPRWVETDPVRFQQVMNNLISNAYKFTPEGGEIGVDISCLARWWAPKECEAGGIRFIKNVNERERNKSDSQLGDVIAIDVDDCGVEEPRCIEEQHENLDLSSCTVNLRSAGLGVVRWEIPNPGAEETSPKQPTVMTRSPPAEWGNWNPEFNEWILMEVSVYDTGIGMSPEVVGSLFRPYAQAAVSTMREYGGSGLGLAITEKIVRLMRGTVGVETEVGKGSRFTFVVPMRVGKTPADGVGVTVGPWNGIRRRRSWRPGSARKSRSLGKESSDGGSQKVDSDSGVVDGQLDEIVVGDTREADKRLSITSINREDVEHAFEEVVERVEGDVRRRSGNGHLMPPATPITETSNDVAQSPFSSTTLSSGTAHSISASLPAVVDMTLNQPTTTATATAAQANERQRHILIVDDSTINRRILLRMLQRVLSSEDFRIDEAENGKQAVDMVKSAKCSNQCDWYHIIFMVRLTLFSRL